MLRVGLRQVFARSPRWWVTLLVTWPAFASMVYGPNHISSETWDYVWICAVALSGLLGCYLLDWLVDRLAGASRPGRESTRSPDTLS